MGTVPFFMTILFYNIWKWGQSPFLHHFFHFGVNFNIYFSISEFLKLRWHPSENFKFCIRNLEGILA